MDQRETPRAEESLGGGSECTVVGGWGKAAGFYLGRKGKLYEGGGVGGGLCR